MPRDIVLRAGPQFPVGNHQCARDLRYPAAWASASLQNISSARVCS
jgi:hypothetical protein